MNKKIKHFETNTKGRDFVVGDLHGCYDELMHILAHIKFDKETDRLFSVGDLEDRGPRNVECLELLKEPWFHSVQGNHEALMHESVIDDNFNMYRTWMYNGGEWSRSVDPDKLKELSLLARECPLIITVGEKPNRFNVVHAEMFLEQDVVGQVERRKVPVTDAMIDAYVFNEQILTWGRTICRKKVVSQPWHDPDNMSLTFVGHTPMRNVVQFGQQMYIDCGGCFYYINTNVSHELALIVAEPNAKRYFRYGMALASITEHSFDEVEKWAT